MSLTKSCAAILVVFTTTLISVESQAQNNPQQELSWYKQNYNQQTYYIDNYKCLQSSITQSQPNNSVVVPDSGSQLIQMVNQDKLYKACMLAQGYSLQPSNSHSINSTNSPSPNASPERLAYCISANQIALKNMKKSYKESDDPNLNALQNHMKEATERSIHAAKVQLQSQELYSFKTNKYSPAIQPQIEQAKDDADELINSKYKECMGNCQTPEHNNPDSLQKFMSCAKDCEPEMSDGVKRILSCTSEISP